MGKEPYRAVPVNDAMFAVPAYYAVEGPGPTVVQRFTTIDAAERSAELLNAAYAAGVASVVTALLPAPRGAKA